MLPSRRTFLGACLASATLPAFAAPSALAWLTSLDGDATLLRGADRFALAEGVALQADDILDVPAATRLARIEFADGATLALGPGSRALLAPRLPGDRIEARAYLLTGWAKLGAPANAAAGLLAPVFDLSTRGGIAVLWVQPGVSTAFAEAGEATLPRTPGPARTTLRPGELASLAATAGARLDHADRPTPAFVAALPRSFMDTLPARAAKFRDAPVPPHRVAPIAYADAQPWLDAEPALRRALMARWRPLAQKPEFRNGLVAGLAAHPEWRPILFPPVFKPTP